jgi:hypothetical protein
MYIVIYRTLLMKEGRNWFARQFQYKEDAENFKKTIEQSGLMDEDITIQEGQK